MNNKHICGTCSDYDTCEYADNYNNKCVNKNNFYWKSKKKDKKDEYINNAIRKRDYRRDSESE